MLTSRKTLFTALEKFNLARDEPSCLGRGELAFSVESDWRRQGIGTALMKRLMLAARNRHLTPLTLHCSSENDAMLALARKYGASLTRTWSGMKSYLPASSPTILSRLHELAENGCHIAIASVDSHISKLPRQIRHVRSFALPDSSCSR